MDLMLAAEQFAQAQAAAAAAAAQYYASAAINAANFPGSQGHLLPPPPPGSTPTTMAISGTTLLGPQFMAQSAMPMAMHFIQQQQQHQHQQQQQQHQHQEQLAAEAEAASRDDRRDRRERDRHRDRGRDRSRSRSRERRDRDRSRERRDRRRDRSRDRDRSPRRDRRDRSPDSDDDKDIPPNNTIMVRGLACHITESDIRGDITQHGLVARDIRLIRKKETGASRGFAFVEFSRVEEAVQWMQSKKVDWPEWRRHNTAGALVFKDGSRAVVQFSMPRDGRQGEPKVLHDWICAKCGVQNFRRRDFCFKCGGPKTDGDLEGADEVSSHPTNVVLLRGLDALTTEDSVLSALTPVSSLPIKSIRIGRDSLTSASRGVCYVEMNTTVDAMFLHNQLLGEPLSIDDRLASVSYLKTGPARDQLQAQGASLSAAANAALAAAQWTHQNAGANAVAMASVTPVPAAASQQKGRMSDQEVERMAEYSATMYAKTKEEKASYLEYYRNYYRNGGDTDAGATQAVTAAVMPQGSNLPNLGKITVGGVEYKKYPVPDISSYSYEETSGYYYDVMTGLYYDSNSQYYYNSATSKFMYWSDEHRTYLPAPDQDGDEADKGRKGEKDVKVKTAKKIAKDMEKWAKTLNQKKEAAKSNVSAAPMAVSAGNGDRAGSGAEDIAFSLLQKKPGAPVPSGVTSSSSSGLATLAGYGSDSESEETSASAAASAAATSSASNGSDEAQFLDWAKIACLLCKRQFPAKDKLQKHLQLSDLHKQNLESWRRENRNAPPSSSSAPPPPSSSSSSFMSAQQYRDRAKERRQKYGEDDDPRPNRLKEKYLSVMVEAESAALPERAIDSTNIGSKMLQRMGWSEGKGLGKNNQGRTTIVEADRRTHQAGLGSGPSVKQGANETYKDCVKRTLYQRFQDLE